MDKSKVVAILVKESYLARIHGAVGTRMFRMLYALVDGKKQDILGNGNRSCALFVSTVLVGFHLVKEVHASIEGTISDMESSGWIRIRNPRLGCVIIWDATNEEGKERQHIGFYIGNGKAVSNRSRKESPSVHPYRVHKIRDLYWTSKLD